MRTSFGFFSRCLVLPAVLTCVASAAGQLQGTVQSLSFQGPVTGGPVNFTIYLPQGYAAGTTDLPVIYHLHGLGGAHNGNQISSVPASYEAARAAGIIGPAIIVFPNGYIDSMWADSVNSNQPAETNVVQELVPYIESNYRTRTDRNGRVIQGFSMGGFGTIKFAAKFPELFGIAVEYDGALLDYATLEQNHPEIVAEVFDNDPAVFDEYSPWFWTTTNAAVLATDTPIRMVAAALQDGNRRFRDHLIGLGISIDYVETGLPHALQPILSAEGQASWQFIADHLADDVCAPDLNRDGTVTSADYFNFLAAFFQRLPRADYNADGAITSQDYFEFLADFFAGC